MTSSASFTLQPLGPIHQPKATQCNPEGRRAGQEQAGGGQKRWSPLPKRPMGQAFPICHVYHLALLAVPVQSHCWLSMCTPARGSE